MCWRWRARPADHLDVLVIGLLLSVALMGAAANYIAKLLERYRWISYIGLAIVVYVAVIDDLAWLGRSREGAELARSSAELSTAAPSHHRSS